jgi:hypothetical protein
MLRTYPVNQNRLSRFHLGPHDQGLVGREVGNSQRRSLGETETFVQREGVNRLRDNVLGVRARIFSGDENALADVQRRHVAADVFDVTGCVAARDVGKIRKSVITVISIFN